MSEVVVADVLEDTLPSETVVTEKKINTKETSGIKSKAEDFRPQQEKQSAVEKKTRRKKTSKNEQSAVGKNLNSNADNVLDDIVTRTICWWERNEEEWKDVTSRMMRGAVNGHDICYIPWKISTANKQRLADKGYSIFHKRSGTYVSWQNLVLKRLRHSVQ